MRTFAFLTLALLLVGLVTLIVFRHQQASESVSEPEFEQIEENNGEVEPFLFENWKRPEGPLRVGLQVGHWKSNELPDELENLRLRGGGTSGGGKVEWEVNLAIAQEAAKILEQKGIVVDILPATVPPAYWADVFVAIHADGNADLSVSGFKAAAPWRDRTGKASELVAMLEEEYFKVTKMELDLNVSRNMRGYYVFNWRRYEHAIHPMTVAAIIETGFLTNLRDQKILINNPQISAQGIADGIIRFLGS